MLDIGVLADDRPPVTYEIGRRCLWHRIWCAYGYGFAFFVSPIVYRSLFLRRTGSVYYRTESYRI
jgi:hypothetical protein